MKATRTKHKPRVNTDPAKKAKPIAPSGPSEEFLRGQAAGYSDGTELRRRLQDENAELRLRIEKTERDLTSARELNTKHLGKQANHDKEISDLRRSMTAASQRAVSTARSEHIRSAEKLVTMCDQLRGMLGDVRAFAQSFADEWGSEIEAKKMHDTLVDLHTAAAGSKR